MPSFVGMRWTRSEPDNIQPEEKFQSPVKLLTGTALPFVEMNDMVTKLAALMERSVMQCGGFVTSILKIETTLSGSINHVKLRRFVGLKEIL